MRKLILKSFYSPGDITMMTAAVRDLHKAHPGGFKTDVRTLCSALWENNPYLTPLKEDAPGVEFVECSYPLIDRSNVAPYHCLDGYIHFFNKKLGVQIKRTAFHGDIHISDQEKAWYSQVHEFTRKEVPFWIVSAGGKYDVTIKWWSTERFQQVVDYFRGKIQFVQVGDSGHHHPPLQGVIDLRGRTSLRELVRLVYHAQGVLCPVTALMHLAAAIEYRHDPRSQRPCVVIAGGREPVHWEAYPGHQFLHTIGALACCARGGCWRDRTKPLFDGDPRDQQLCVKRAENLPACMKLITAEDVIQSIECYFQGGRLDYLKRNQLSAARKAVIASQNNSFDNQPLTLSSAREVCDRFISSTPKNTQNYKGRGIVICGGGLSYFPGAWVCIRMLRRLGCKLPIQLWHLGETEIDGSMKEVVAQYGVECVDAFKVRRRHPIRRLGGWELKPYAILHSPFREVLLLDADNMPVVNPEFLFSTREFKETGAIFWPDFGRLEKTEKIWNNCGLTRPEGPELESGQIVVDKKRCWQALRLTLWFNEQSDFYYQYLHGDKETFHLAFKRTSTNFSMPKTPVKALTGTMCQHDFAGKRIFQHRNTDKWNLFLLNKTVAGFMFEPECRDYILELRKKWDGRASSIPRGPGRSRKTLKPTFTACLITCPKREALRNKTLQALRETDWGSLDIHVEFDQGPVETPEQNQTLASYLAIKAALSRSSAEYILFLEDDLDFNAHLLSNLLSWEPILQRSVTLASLYNPGVSPVAVDVEKQVSVVPPNHIFGSQAFLLNRRTARYVLHHWAEGSGKQDIRISRLAGRLKNPIFYHTPSLVQHVGDESTWGGGFHSAHDFDKSWRNPNSRNMIFPMPAISTHTPVMRL